MKTNILYYGDNLQILRDHIPDESVDLIYLDPPFNSNRSYNVLFKEASGAGSEAQIEAFEDTWHWGPAAQATYEEVVTGPHQSVARMLKAMVEGLGSNDVTAYLSMMAVRLIELHRVLKSTGSIYLHCDPTAGPYLRVLMDSVFQPQHFRNEVVWKRTTTHSDAKRWSPVADTLLYYGKTDRVTWNPQYVAHTDEYLEAKYRYQEPDGRRYRLHDMTSPNPRPNMMYEWKGHESPQKGWRFSRETMTRLDAEGRIWYPKDKKRRPQVKRYLDEMSGVVLGTVWTDISPINSQAQERLGYPTQKPLSLLERIISASSNPRDIVLDPFCGCGTAIHAAQKLGRKWIGMDITYLAIGLVRRRMQDAFPRLAVEEDGVPVDLTGAQHLADHDKYQFQWWALDRLGAVPVAGKKKGADKGIDGVIPILTGGTAEKPTYGRVIVSVKGGAKVSVSMLRDLKGTLTDEDPLGIFLTLAEPTAPMKEFAATTGFYESKLRAKKFPRMQIVTVEELLDGKTPDIPWGKSPFAKAATEKKDSQQAALVIEP